LPYTAQKPAEPGKILALSIREVLFTLSWGALGGAVLFPFTGYWFMGIPVAILISVYFLSMMETGRETGPLLALDLRQYSSLGRRDVSLWSTFFRIMLSVLLFPPLMLSCITLLFHRRSIPELVTGIRITEVDHRFDPRPGKTIEEIRKSAQNRTRVLIMVPLAVSAFVFVLHYSVPEVVMIQESSISGSLPEGEQELLVHYLEMTNLHPEELEYHVRLASLYYRNGMEQDLLDELATIREIDPNHAILLLSDTTYLGFQVLEPLPGDSSMLDPNFFALQEAPAESTLSLPNDSLSADSAAASADTTIMEQDTLHSVGNVVQTEGLEPDPSQSGTAVQSPEPDTAPTPAGNDDTEPGEQADAPDAGTTEETFESDTLIQP